MKHTSKRKKMLLSSVAMLSVAAIALGSATYAWFTSNPNAKATGISLKTTASAGLQVRTDTDSTWSHDATLAKDLNTFNLTPASENQTEGSADLFSTVIAKDADKYNAKDGEDMDSATTGHTGGEAVYAEKVYFRLSPGSDTTANASKKVQLTSVTINKADGAQLTDAIKVAVVDSNKKIIGTYTLDAGTDNHGALVAKSDSDKTQTAQDFAPTLTTAGDITDIDVNATALSNTATLTKYVSVYVYLDGQHTDCASENVSDQDASEIISSVSLGFTLV